MALNLLLPLRITASFASSNRAEFKSYGTPQRQVIQGPLEGTFSRVTKPRSSNYEWDPKLIESTTSPYSGPHYQFGLEVLKRDVSKIMKEPRDLPEKLRLVDSMDRLGVAYHFPREIAEIVEQVLGEEAGDDDMFNTALRFRILRQYGHDVSPDVFEKFKDKEGNFNESFIRDVQGLLSLYEASYLGVYGEDILDEVRDFATRQLKSLKGCLRTDVVGHEIEQALDLPLWWRLLRLESRNYIKVYEKEDGMNLVLLKFAKLDFNVVQSVHQAELRDISRWWTDMGFKEKLNFSRDLCIELYIWGLGVSYEPQFTRSRTAAAKVTTIIKLIEEMYSTYGSIDELELFTQAIERWNHEGMENLSYCMKLAYLAVLGLVTSDAYKGINDFGVNFIPIIKKEWEDICESYLVKARWLNRGYTPTLEEYLSNGRISTGASAILIHGCLFLGKSLGMKPADYLEQVSKLIYWSSMVVRLTDDLANFKGKQEQGKLPSSIECYMKESGKSEEDASKHMMNLVMESWKGLNKECLSASTLPRQLVNVFRDFSRVSHFFHQCRHGETKEGIMSMFFEPI